MMRDTTIDQTIWRLFTYHAPTPDQMQRYVALREAAQRYAREIAMHCPESAERTLAIRRVHEASMLANASIAVTEAVARDKAADSGS